MALEDHQSRWRDIRSSKAKRDLSYIFNNIYLSQSRRVYFMVRWLMPMLLRNLLLLPSPSSIVSVAGSAQLFHYWNFSLVDHWYFVSLCNESNDTSNLIADSTLTTFVCIHLMSYMKPLWVVLLCQLMGQLLYSTIQLQQLQEITLHLSNWVNYLSIAILSSWQLKQKKESNVEKFDVEGMQISPITIKSMRKCVWKSTIGCFQGTSDQFDTKKNYIIYRMCS